MGWLFTRNQTLKQLIAERSKAERSTSPANEEYDHPITRIWTPLKHCYRGGRFSGILWSVWEITKIHHVAWNHDVVEVVRIIECDLMQYRKNDGWGFKSMDESAHPFYYSCPLGYLQLAPVICEQWRQGVRNYHESRKKKAA